MSPSLELLLVLTEAVKTTSELTNKIDSNSVYQLGAPFKNDYNQSLVGVLPLMGVLARAVLTEAVKTTSELTNKIDYNTVSPSSELLLQFSELSDQSPTYLQSQRPPPGQFV